MGWGWTPLGGGGGGGAGGGGLTAAAIDGAPAASATALTDHLPASQTGTLVYETPQQLLDVAGLLAAAGALVGANVFPLVQSGAAKGATLTALQTALQSGGGLALNVGGLAGVLSAPQPPIIGAGSTQAVAGNDARLTNARTPTGAAGGDLSSTYPNPTVSKINGLALGGAAPTDGQVLTWVNANSDVEWKTPSAGGLTNPVAAGSLAAPGLQVGEATTGLVGQLGTHTLSIAAFGIEAARFETIAGGVNFLDFVPSATGGGGSNGVKIQSKGSDASIDLYFNTQGVASRYIWMVGGSNKMDLTDTGGQFDLRVLSNGSVQAQNAKLQNNVSFNADSGISRVAPKVVSAFDGGTNNAGWFTDAGTSRVAADLTNATATMAAITGLSAALQAGRWYFVRMVIKGVNSQATEGLQFDFNGGTATMTEFWVGAGILASGGTDVIGTNISTSLAGVINFTTFTGESVIIFEGYLKCNVAGTLVPRFAENTSAAGTATVRKGSLMVLRDAP